LIATQLSIQVAMVDQFSKVLSIFTRMEEFWIQVTLTQESKVYAKKKLKVRRSPLN